jgi:hypothetical protein
MPATKIKACDRIVAGLNPVMIQALQESHESIWKDQEGFPKLAIYALEELYWVMFRTPPSEAPELPAFNPEEKFPSPPSKLRRAEDGYFLVLIPDLIEQEYNLLLRAHDYNKTGLLNRALVLQYRAVRQMQASRGNQGFLAKYPEL